MTEIKISTDENGLADCKCGANELGWRPVRDRHAREADHTLEEVREIGGAILYEEREPEDWNEDVGGMPFEEHIEQERKKAERNGLTAYCRECYGTMSATVATDELADDMERAEDH